MKDQCKGTANTAGCVWGRGGGALPGSTLMNGHSVIFNVHTQNAESRKKLDALQRVVDELESQVHRQERQRTDMEVRLKTDRAKWDAEKVTLQGQINRVCGI